jgi:RNA polymerase sigma-70 factor (ECF subfamily)
LTDEQILQQVKQGNTSAFKILITRHEPQIAATVVGMLGKCPEAEDVGQETFIRFFRSVDNFQGKSSVATYLTRIAINLSLNELKRRKRKSLFFNQNLTEAEFELPGENPSDGYDGMNELIQKAIQRLEPKFKSVIVLRLIDGYATNETAKILKIPVGTVLSRLARAQKKLKEILSPMLQETL